MNRTSRVAIAISGVLGVAVLSGCGAGPDRAKDAADRTHPERTTAVSPSSSPTGSTTPRSTSAATPAPSRSTSPAGPATTNAFAARCHATGEIRSALERLHARTGSVSDGEGSRLPVTVAGSGAVALVVLPGADACAARSFLAAAGSDRRFRVFVVDDCTSHAAHCVGEFGLDPAAQAGAVVDRVRSAHHTQRVVLVGVGRGGADAVQDAAVGLPVDGVVNVSGTASAADLRRVTVPLLNLYDDPAAAAASGARTVARENPRRIRVADAPASGWAALTGPDAVLTATGRDALAFAAR